MRLPDQPIRHENLGPEHSPTPASSFWSSNRLWWFVLALILAVTVAIRLRLLSVPLERDEGEYAYGGQLLLQGVAPYQGLYTMKWPGTHAAYALIMALFGQTPNAIHAGLIGITLATAALVFLLARRAHGDVAGAVAAGVYALLSINPVMLGLAAHATHFVVLPALAGILLIQQLDEGTSQLRIFFAGLLLGLAAFMKQSGAFLGVFALAWIAWQECLCLPRNKRRMATRLGLLLLGGALPLLAMFAAIMAAGAFNHFWFWTVKYARAYASLRTPADGLPDLRNIAGALFRSTPALWIMALLGILLLLLDRSLRILRPFLLGFLAFSFMAVCPGWYFRAHYFLLLLPAIALLAGVTAQVSHGWIARKRNSAQANAVLMLVFAGIAIWPVVQSRTIFFRVSPAQLWHWSYTPALFPEAVQVGEYLRSHCPANGRIAVLGSEPEIYFCSRQRSVTGYIYMYPLMEPQPYALAMQQEMIREIGSGNPDYVVWVNEPLSWMQRTNSPVLIFDWFQQYRREHLELAAWVDVISPLQTEYHWSASNALFAPRSPYWLAIYKNKGSR